ncbi:unnamed protein product [Arctogadus glacialis]
MFSIQENAGFIICPVEETPHPASETPSEPPPPPGAQRQPAGQMGAPRGPPPPETRAAIATALSPTMSGGSGGFIYDGYAFCSPPHHSEEPHMQLPPAPRGLATLGPLDETPGAAASAGPRVPVAARLPIR